MCYRRREGEREREIIETILKELRSEIKRIWREREGTSVQLKEGGVSERERACEREI